MIKNRSKLINHGNKSDRNVLLEIAEKTIQSVHPKQIVAEKLEIEDNLLYVEDTKYDISSYDNIFIVGGGKGSSAISDEVNKLLNHVPTDGIISEKENKSCLAEGVDVIESGHPLPNQNSVKAGRNISQIAKKATKSDLFIVCIAGGASAQIVSPPKNISTDDMRVMNEVLLNSGMDIESINTVRKHVSNIKGGRLTKMIHPADIVTLQIIDEPANEPWGPTVGDKTNFIDAIEVLQSNQLTNQIPDSIISYIKTKQQSPDLESPTPSEISNHNHQISVLARPNELCEAAQRYSRNYDFTSKILSSSIEGESQDVAHFFSQIIDEIVAYQRPIEPPCVLISGGETTVTVSQNSGEGGPNQEFILKLAKEIAKHNDLTALSIGTDGTDGPTDAAGGIVDDCTIENLINFDVCVDDCLASNNSSSALSKVDDIIYTGSTGTNVMDLRLILIRE